ncbi:MAG: MotA/TolQ/ExbB proton channel family protein [Rhodomicrobium sp.]
MDTPAALLPHGLSFIKLIEDADPVVQAVMLVLALASVVCWAVGFEKLIRYAAFSRQLASLERFVEVQPGKQVPAPRLAARFGALASSEPRPAAHSLSEYQANLERSLQSETATQLRGLQAGLPLLATVGSTAPFVGLFGTVWGIMNSFTGIAVAKDTSLAVVAPGIAEALLATAVGLAAAIPAVVFYNLANVFLSNNAERLSIAAGRYAKFYAYGALGEGAAGSLDNGRSILAE